MALFGLLSKVLAPKIGLGQCQLSPMCYILLALILAKTLLLINGKSVGLSTLYVLSLDNLIDISYIDMNFHSYISNVEQLATIWFGSLKTLIV